MKLLARCNCHQCGDYLQRWQMHNSTLCVECAEQLPPVVAERAADFRALSKERFTRHLRDLPMCELVDIRDSVQAYISTRKAS